MAEFAILLNPAADNGRASRKQKQLEFMLDNYDVSYRLFVSESETHLRNLVSTCTKDYHTIVGAGGDGTFNIIINELMKQGLSNRFAMVPLGSQNDIAREFGVDSLENACSALKNGATREVDLGMITGDDSSPSYFLGTASLALGTTVNKYMNNIIKRHPILTRSNFIYDVYGFLGILHSFSSKKVPILLKLIYNKSFTDNFSLVVFNNTSFYAHGFRPSPDANPYDGLLDCFCVTSESPSRFFKIWSSHRKGKHTDEHDVKLIKASEFKVMSRDKVEIQADGQLLGAYKDITISVKPKALSVIVNPQYMRN